MSAMTDCTEVVITNVLKSQHSHITCRTCLLLFMTSHMLLAKATSSSFVSEVIVSLVSLRDCLFHSNFESPVF